LLAFCYRFNRLKQLSARVSFRPCLWVGESRPDVIGLCRFI
jgi:hypothetical protein